MIINYFNLFGAEDEHYPWFKKAQTTFELSCVDMRDVQQRLEKVGFFTKEQQIIVPVKILTKEWSALLKKRFWSNLSGFSDKELNYEISLLDFGKQKYLHFNDHLSLLIASKDACMWPLSIG